MQHHMRLKQAMWASSTQACLGTLTYQTRPACVALLQISKQRRQWKRFGAAARETEADSVTVRHVEEIPFDRIRPAKATAQEKKFTDMQV